MKNPETGKPLRLKLSQRKHKRALRWLLDDGVGFQEGLSFKGVYRETGRSTLMAVVFIETAMSHPCTPILFFDHIPSAKQQTLMKIRLQQFVDANKNLGEFRVTDKDITFLGKAKKSRARVER